MVRGWRNLTPALAMVALAAWLPVLNPGVLRGGNVGAPATAAVRARGPAPGAYPWLKPGQVLWYTETAQKLVALTFNDGPDPTVTPGLLAVLARHGAHATFFPVGERLERYPDLGRRLVSAGHEIGNHGYGHAPLQGRSTAAISAELRRAGQIINQVTGRAPRLFRPPDGDLLAPVVAVASGLGYRTVLSSRAGFGGGDRATARLLESVTPGDILLLHEGPGDPLLVQAVDALLTGLTRRGYQAVTVSQLLAAGGGAPVP